MQVSASRVVAFAVTPILSAVSGLAVSFAAKYGLNVNAAEVTTYGATVATLVAGAAIKWLHGNSLWEREVAHLQAYAGDLQKVAPGLLPAVEHAAVSAAQKGVDAAVNAIGEEEVANPAPPLTAVPDPAPAPAPAPEPPATPAA